MHFCNSGAYVLALVLFIVVLADRLCEASRTVPTASPLSNPAYGPIAGASSLYTQTTQVPDPFPGDLHKPVDAVTTGPAAPDDVLMQNLLSAEWAVYSLYQQGVDMLNKSAFTGAGFPDETYQRIQQIRDNEDGHLRIFQDLISNTSVKPGACQYNFGFDDAASFLETAFGVELGSEAFLSGLVLQATQPLTKSALVAIAEVEARHSTWLLTVLGGEPFVGPSELVYPYANQILDLINDVIIPGSCPALNPPYPIGSQNLPFLAANSTPVAGATIQLLQSDPSRALVFIPNQRYWAVVNKGVYNYSMPYDPKVGLVDIPADLDPYGMVAVSIADQDGAPTADSVVAGPVLATVYPFFSQLSGVSSYGPTA